MTFTAQSRVSDIAAGTPATIKIFQQHQIDFCCEGRATLGDACARRQLDVDAILTELEGADRKADESIGWLEAPIADLVRHIQKRYHEPLRAELGRLSGMMQKVVSRHGDRYPETLIPLGDVFDRFSRDLRAHMAKEDAMLFPAFVALAAASSGARVDRLWLDVDEPIDRMESEHAEAGEALARMRALTNGYAPPEGACNTFRGLYYGLAELEREMHVHVHLENHVLFPRAAALARSVGA
jgi:regulator of cell morphogenesis and NO signaling